MGYEEIIFENMLALKNKLTTLHPDYNVHIGSKYEGEIEEYKDISIFLAGAVENPQAADTMILNIDVVLGDFAWEVMPEDTIQTATQLMDEINAFIADRSTLNELHIHELVPDHAGEEETGYINWNRIRLECYVLE